MGNITGKVIFIKDSFITKSVICFHKIYSIYLFNSIWGESKFYLIIIIKLWESKSKFYFVR